MNRHATHKPAQPVAGCNLRDIAVIGLACRFPGAPDRDAFWQMLHDRRTAVSEVPRDRWDAQAHYDPSGSDPAGACSLWGAFLDDLAHFDPGFFNISPREAKSLDPQHRLLLETSVEALEHAGQPLTELKGSRTGVFVGICNTEYAGLTGAGDDYSMIDKYFGTGNAISVASGRISYALNLNGPAVSIDTACSSSLVAVHMAVASLRAGESDLCLAAGVNVALSPSVGIYFSQLGAVSRAPECRPFDNGADGYVRGEGCATVVLKPLWAAQRDGDRVMAVIRGSAINQDGRSAGLTAPNVDAQEAVLRAALADAGVTGSEVVFAEAHGTGTRLGDPIEAQALGRVYGCAPERSGPLHLGAVKANIGHLESAAGIAGLVKAIEAVHRRVIPPQANFARCNEMIDLEALGLSIPAEPLAWPENQGFAAVSSFGFSGTNAHVVLGCAPGQDEAAAKTEDAPYHSAPVVLPLSARSGASLTSFAQALHARLSAGEDPRALSRGMALRRSHFKMRDCVVGSDRETLLAALDNVSAPSRPSSKRNGKGPVFLFSGQGGQWPGMGAAVSQYEPARERINDIDAVVRSQVGWSVWQAMNQPQDLAVPRIVTSQVAIFALQAGLDALFRDWGLEPAAVLGHSMGEIAAALSAEILPLEAATHLSLERSHCLAQVAGTGLMALVDTGAEEVSERIGARAGSVVIAARNGPQNAVISGPAKAVEEVVADLGDHGIFARVVNTDGVPGHSPLIAHLGEDLAKRLDGISPTGETVPFYSAVDGGRCGGDKLTTDFWCRNLLHEVRFDTAVEVLINEGYRDFLEIGPRPVLLPAVRGRMLVSSEEGLLTAGLAPPDSRVAYSPERAVAALYRAGYDPNWRTMLKTDIGWLPPPSYPWQKSYHWITELRDEAAASRSLKTGRREEDKPVVALERLLRRHDRFGLQSLNMRHLAPRVWVTQADQVAVFASVSSTACLVWAAIGEEDATERALAELQTAADESGLVLAVCRTVPGSTAGSPEDGFLVPFGLTQTLPLCSFDPSANGYKRLRSRLNRYQEANGHETKLFKPGMDPQLDASVTGLIRTWMSARSAPVPAADRLIDEIASGRLPVYRRLYVAGEGDRVHGAIVLSQFGTGTGWLMDMEFYDRETPPGCTERLIVDLAAELKQEGAEVLSLGGSYGMPRFSENADAASRGLRRQVQFKSKFRPEEEEIFLHFAKRPGGDEQDRLLSLLGGQHFQEEVTSRTLSRVLEPSTGSAASQTHPFALRRLDIAGPTLVYQARIDAQDPVLIEHQVAGRPMWPAAGSLECVASLAKMLRPDAAEICLTDVTFEGALGAAEGENIDLEIHIGSRDDLPVEAVVYARISGEAEGRWTRLMHCAFDWMDLRTDPLAPMSVDEADIDIEEFYRGLSDRGIDYGPCYRNLERLRSGQDGKITARLGGETRDGFVIGPALLDTALHTLSAGGDETTAVMMHSIQRLQVKRAISPQADLNAVTRSEPGGSASADLDLYGPDGKADLLARGILARPARMPMQEPKVAVMTHKAWEERKPGGRPAGELFVFGPSDLMTALAAEPGDTNTRLHHLSSVEELVCHADRVAGGTILFAVEPLATAELAARFQDLCRLVGFLDEHSRKARLFLVASNEGASAAAGQMSTAALRALSNVISSEHPELQAGFVELAGVPAGEAATAMLSIMSSPANETEWRVSEKGIEAARLALQKPAETPAFRPRQDRSYLVTGWTGGIGQALLADLIGAGAGGVVGLARTPGGPEERAALEQLAGEAGCNLEFVAGDVTQKEDVLRAVASARSVAPLGGVFHAAGLLNDGLLISQNSKSFADALAVKFDAGVVLHEATLEDKLEAFVLFSSAASLFGPPGQGPHAAASAALDALAVTRRAAGLPATSIGWGAWRGIGQAAALGHDKALSELGMATIGQEEALTVMKRLIGTAAPPAWYAPVNWSRLARAVPDLAGRPVFQDLVPAVSQDREAIDRVSPETTSPDETGEDMRDVLRGTIAETLLIEPDAVDPGLSLEANGLDSIMIVELRETLGRRYGTTYSLIEFFRAPDLNALAQILRPAQ